MDKFTISKPQELARILGVRVKELPRLVKLYFAIELYREGKVSLGKASEIAGVSQWEMVEVLASKGIPLQYDAEDLEEDIKTLEKLL